MKNKSQFETFKSIRKPLLPQNRVERPMKGGGYRRREKFASVNA